MTKDFLKPIELATQLGVTTGRIYQLLDAGTIPHTRLGRSITVKHSDWEEWLAQQQPRRIAVQTTEFGKLTHSMWRELINLVHLLVTQTENKGKDIE